MTTSLEIPSASGGRGVGAYSCQTRANENGGAGLAHGAKARRVAVATGPSRAALSGVAFPFCRPAAPRAASRSPWHAQIYTHTQMKATSPPCSARGGGSYTGEGRTHGPGPGGSPEQPPVPRSPPAAAPLPKGLTFFLSYSFSLLFR